MGNAPVNGELRHAAVKGDSKEIVRLIEARIADPNASYDSSLRTALHEASAHGHSDCVISLIKGGADPDPVDVLRKTPLHLACQEGRADVVVELLRAGADSEKPDGSNRTPLYIATFFGHIDVVHALLDAGVSPESSACAWSPLFCASQEGLVDTIEVLVSHGADIDFASESDGRTPLHAASSAGKLQAVKKLIALGADPLKRTKKGDTASDVAGCKEMFSFLARASGVLPLRLPLLLSWNASELRCELKDVMLSGAVTLCSGLHGRLGGSSPLQLLVGFPNIVAFIFVMSLPDWACDPLSKDPELL